MSEDKGGVDASREGAVAVLTFNRPDRLNAMDTAMASAVLEHLQRWASDASVRAVLIRGAGRGFMAGGDISEFAGDPENYAAGISRLIAPIHAFIKVMRDMPKPVVAAVHGTCAGVGNSIMMACDMAVAAEGTKFTMAYTKIGTSPDGSGSFFLPRKVGMARAMEIALLSDVFDAGQALQWGMINRVVPADALEAEAMALANRLAEGPTRAFSNVKRLLNASLANDLTAQLEMEEAAFLDCAKGPDFHEGIQAFAARREPAFRGE